MPNGAIHPSLAGLFADAAISGVGALWEGGLA